MGQRYLIWHRQLGIAGPVGTCLTPTASGPPLLCSAERRLTVALTLLSAHLVTSPLFLPKLAPKDEAPSLAPSGPGPPGSPASDVPHRVHGPVRHARQPPCAAHRGLLHSDLRADIRCG